MERYIINKDTLMAQTFQMFGGCDGEVAKAILLVKWLGTIGLYIWTSSCPLPASPFWRARSPWWFFSMVNVGRSVDVELLGRDSVFVPGPLWVSCF